MFETFYHELADVPHLIWISAIVVLSLLTHKFINVTMNKSAKLWSEKFNLDPTKFKFMQHFLVSFTYFFGFILIVYSIPSIRSVAVSMLAGAGIFAAAIAFASQQTIANMINGLFIVFFQPFRVNDRIRINNDISGIVEDITMRHTVIKDFENNRVVIPNTVIGAAVVVNLTIEDPKINKKMVFRVAHLADIQKAIEIITNVCDKHPLRIDVRTEKEKNELPPSIVRMTGWDDKGVTIEAFVWAENAANAFALQCDVIQEVIQEFRKQNIPFIRTI